MNTISKAQDSSVKEKLQTPILSDFPMIVVGLHLQAEFAQFIIWCATPSQFRKFKTQKEFAKTIGVSQDTITDWKKRPEFRILVMKAIKEWVWEHIPDVIGGLYSNAKYEGRSKDVETFLRLAGINIKNDNLTN